MRVKIVLLLVASLITLFPLMRVNADGGLAQVTANISVPLLLDGRETDGAVESVPIGSNVCVGTVIKYTRTNERHRFFSWQYQPILGSAGSTGTNLAETNQSLGDECIVVTEGGTYTAKYMPEVLFQVRSGVDAYKQSRWVERGTVIDLSAPEIVAGEENVRYRFNGWNGGESPFTPENQIAVLEPTVLELGWTVEYYVKIEDIDGSFNPVSGWHPANESLLIRTPEEILQNGGREKLTFQKWEVVYGPLMKKNNNPNMAILVVGPCLLRPIYTESFLVDVKDFHGVLSQEWVQKGEEFALAAPTLVEVVPERERYLFQGWEGKEGLAGNELDLIIDSPLTLEAIYQRQFKLNVRSPYGSSGEGWFNEGQKTIIMAPPEPQSMLFFKRAFDGFLGYGDGATLSKQPVITVQVNEPMTVTAAYRSEINPNVLFLLVGVLVVGTLVYIGTEWGPIAYRRWRPQDVETPALSDEMKRLLG